jgi:hypothetical protein
MECREGCGVCCIIPSISSPIPGMLAGKPAGVRCIHLNTNLKCTIYKSPDRPLVCAGFQADKLVCCNTREEAIKVFTELESLN